MSWKDNVYKIDKIVGDYKPQAYLTLSNHGGVTIQISDDGDGVRYQWYEEEPSDWQEIKYASSGRTYFTISKTKYYLDEFMKMGW